MANSNGRAAWSIWLDGALAGETIGLIELPSGDWLARSMAIDLGVTIRRGRRFLPYAAARPGRRIGQEHNQKTIRDVVGP